MKFAAWRRGPEMRSVRASGGRKRFGRPGALLRATIGWLGAGLALALALYVAVLGGLYATQRQLLYFPDTTRPDRTLAGVPWVQEAGLVTEDGLALLAWYAPPAEPGGFVVLYLHGNGGNIAFRAARLRRFAEVGWGALLPEYRGYGGNPGLPSEAGLAMDARAALDALGRMGVAPERTLLWGESLGSGVAVRLAAERPVAALLLESPFTSVAALARRRFPFVPVGLLLQDRFDALSRIASVRTPAASHAGRPRRCRAARDGTRPPRRRGGTEGAVARAGRRPQ
jgi:uncharacterized protein